MDPKLQARIVRWAAWLIVIAFLALAVPVGVFTAAPIWCASCHEEQDLAGQPSGSSAHEGVACVSCHVGPTLTERVSFGYYQAFGMMVTLVSTHDTRISRIQDSACVRCHDDLGTITEAGGLRVRHDVCAEGSTCTSCHSTVAHPEAISWPTTYAMEKCLSCHGAREASQNCESCHTGRLERRLPRTGTFPITHGPNWRRTHGMGEMSTCAACHDTDSFCTPCHGPGVPHTPRFVSVHGPISSSSEAQCTSCHKQSFCDECHVYEMPHPLEFTLEHSAIVAEEGEGGCATCHVQADCVNCHELHVHPGGAGPLSPIRGARP